MQRETDSTVKFLRHLLTRHLHADIRMLTLSASFITSLKSALASEDVLAIRRSFTTSNHSRLFTITLECLRLLSTLAMWLLAALLAIITFTTMCCGLVMLPQSRQEGWRMCVRSWMLCFGNLTKIDESPTPGGDFYFKGRGEF